MVGLGMMCGEVIGFVWEALIQSTVPRRAPSAPLAPTALMGLSRRAPRGTSLPTLDLLAAPLVLLACGLAMLDRLPVLHPPPALRGTAATGQASKKSVPQTHIPPEGPLLVLRALNSASLARQQACVPA